ncbi:MAG TPA: sigma-70 family RNA polymerase sigma factor [Armatimonadota bacterium]|jgi:RNA polymerase sigma-70 factor (ECF subfamily)
MLNLLHAYLNNWLRSVSPVQVISRGQDALAIELIGEAQPARLYSEDEGLVDRARYGDHGAFRQLFDRHSPLVYRVAYRMVGHPEDAADLTQDVFVRAYERLSTLQHGQAFQAWVTRLTVNMVRDHQRRRRIDTTPWDISSPEAEEVIERSLPSSDPPLDQRLMTHELSQQIQDALLRLSPEHRAVIILHHLENVPVEDMSATLQVPVGTIKSRLARARAELRRRLESYISPELP